MTHGYLIQCPFCNRVHVARVCIVCNAVYCQKYAEIHKKGNGECCSKECTLTIWDKLKTAGAL